MRLDVDLLSQGNPAPLEHGARRELLDVDLLSQGNPADVKERVESEK